jgi:hypothetical protein
LKPMDTNRFWSSTMVVKLPSAAFTRYMPGIVLN